MTRQKQSFFNWLGSIFLNGLIAILPLTLTIALFTFAIRQIVHWLEPLKRFLIKHHYLSHADPVSSFTTICVAGFTFRVPYIEVIIVVLVIFLLGLLMHNIILSRLMHMMLHGIERLVARVPLVRTVYAGIKQLVNAFSMQDKLTFKKVVLVEFPRPGIYSLGFLTSELPPEVSPEPNKHFYNVFIPTTPNPTSGFFVIISEESISFIDLTRQEAMAMIISGGIIQPERFTQG